MSWFRFGDKSKVDPPSQAAAVAVAKKDPSIITLFSMNVYLIPHYFVNKANFSCKNQQPRAKGIGQLIRSLQPDVVCLQETWGSSLWEIEAPLKQKGSAYSVLSCCQSWGFTTLDTMWQYANSRGGLWVAHREAGEGSAFKRRCAEKWASFSFSNTSSKKGMVAARYELAAQPDRYLVVMNLHLDPHNDNDAIVKQFEDLRKFVRNLLTDEKFLGGNPAEQAKKCGLVIVGDYNTMVDSELGKKVFPAWGLGINAGENRSRDLYGEQFSQLSPTGPQKTYDPSTNSLASYHGDAGRIDLQIAIDAFEGTCLRPVRAVKAEVLTQEKGKELSDHWPVFLELKME